MTRAGEQYGHDLDVPEGSYEALASSVAEFARLDRADGRRERWREDLVLGYLPVAEHIARRFSYRGQPQEDLIQVATLGLINAIDRYDPDRGTDFLSFAIPTIMGEVRHYFRDSAWTLRMPRKLKELRMSISSAITDLSQTLGRAPTTSEIAEKLNITREEALEGLQASNAYRTVSLDGVLQNTDELQLADAVGADDGELVDVDDRQALQPLLEQLPQRERRILVLRFFGNMTQTQIAEQVGISQMHVSRLLDKTLTWLRSQLFD